MQKKSCVNVATAASDGCVSLDVGSGWRQLLELSAEARRKAHSVAGLSFRQCAQEPKIHGVRGKGGSE
jgi:hypothetical protein